MDAVDGATRASAQPDHSGQRPLADVRHDVGSRVVGREHEIDMVLAAVDAGRDLLLEGPPGTSKSTLLHAITESWGIPLLFVEGNADLTPAKIVGHHNPARVLREDYTEDNFVEGPLVSAMRQGGLLYIEELNRAPDDTLNTLLTALAERRISVPRVGTVTARPTFRLVATMNPYDNIGTTRLSTSVHDRLCRLSVEYQDEVDEQQIVGLRANIAGVLISGLADLIGDAVAITRMTRDHPDVRQGSSVRGAVDLTLVTVSLLAMRKLSVTAAPVTGSESPPGRVRYARAVLDATMLALSGRIHLDDAAETTAEELLLSLWRRRFADLPAEVGPG